MKDLSTEMPPQLIAKRKQIAKMLDMGITLLRELNLPNHRNYDATFPRPFRLTKKGPAYFCLVAVNRWIDQRRSQTHAQEEKAH